MINLLKKEALHFIAGTGIGLSLLFLPRDFILIIFAAITLIMIILEIAKYIFPALSKWLTIWMPFIVRRGEERKITGTTYFLLAALFIAFVFPVDIAVTAILFAALGDPVATVIGSRFGRIRLLGKSLEGDLACLTACIAIGILLVHVFHVLPFITAIIGALVATVFQAFDLPVNDNVTIPVVSAIVMWIVSLFIG